MDKKSFLAKLTYALICNLFMSFLINMTGSLLVSTTIDWKVFGINFAVSYIIGMSISMFIPLMTIGKWFTAKFKVDNETYTSNIKYRLLASLIISLIYFVVLNPTITLLDYFLCNVQDGLAYFISWCWQAPIILITSYAYSLGSDFIAYHIAHLIDKRF